MCIIIPLISAIVLNLFVFVFKPCGKANKLNTHLQLLYVGECMSTIPICLQQLQS